MQITFPCGAKGRAEFCPGVCQYGEFCKIAKTKKEEPRGLADVHEVEGTIEEVPEEEPKIDFYY
jgi:hypothetical protein